MASQNDSEKDIVPMGKAIAIILTAVIGAVVLMGGGMLVGLNVLKDSGTIQAVSKNNDAKQDTSNKNKKSEAYTGDLIGKWAYQTISADTVYGNTISVGGEMSYEFEENGVCYYSITTVGMVNNKNSGGVEEFKGTYTVKSNKVTINWNKRTMTEISNYEVTSKKTEDVDKNETFKFKIKNNILTTEDGSEYTKK